MEYVLLEDRAAIAEHLRKRADVHVYSLGDLTDEFRPHSRFYGAVEGGEIRAICLVFSLYDPTIVLAISDQDDGALAALFDSVASEFPDYSEIHFSLALRETVEAHFETG